MHGRRPGVAVVAAARVVLLPAVLALLIGFALSGPARAVTLPAGFQEVVAFSGLVNPTVVRFASDGRVFVAEKSGLIKVFDNLNDTTPTIFADLRTNVHNFWDRGLLGLALDPGFPTQPYVYVLYTHDAAIGGTAPRWGSPGVSSDPCPSPPGATADGCVVSGRLSRLQAAGNVMTGPERVLIEDWCQQYPSHSVGSLTFGADGALYVSGGDGASFNFADYGQDGSPLNPCGDPPGGVGGAMTPPSAQGGALRSQDLRTAGDPVTLDGAILRVDPATGAAMPGNPLIGNADLNARRIVAYGLRNPFRIVNRPGTNEIWIGDVGWSVWEEINRIPNPTDGTVRNFGWPCYEGNARQPGYDAANLTVCEELYTTPAAHTPPFFTYNHNSTIIPGEGCPTGSSSIAGIVFDFYPGGTYPAQYDGALFFADYSRDCIWAIPRGSNGLPDPSRIVTFVAQAANPVDVQFGPGGDLFYADFDGGTIRRIRYLGVNQPPTAVAQASPASGNAPLAVAFDGRGSSDPDPGDTLTYDWDLDGNGVFGDSSSATPSRTYSPGTYVVGLRVTDSQGASATTTVTVSASNTPPVARIDAPPAGTLWQVGQQITFAGSATDAQDGSLPASGLAWTLLLQHCPSNCHTHTLQSFSGAGGSFTAPDHEYPSYLELRLTATDAHGATDVETLRLDPRTVRLTFESIPSGLQLAVGGASQTTPFTRDVIQGSTNSLSAPSPQSLGADSYTFASWSDGGAQTHNVVASAAATYRATFTVVDPAGCPCSLWSGTTTPTIAAEPDPNAVELGVKFRADRSGRITGLRFYKGTGNTGTHVGHLWTSAGTLLASATFANETATGWQQVNFATPVDVAANTTYVASYYAPVGRYAVDEGYFSTARTSGPLTALANGADGPNGLYRYGTGGGFPTGSYLSSNYWVDVVFVSSGPDTTAPTISGVQATGITSTGATIGWTTDEAADTQVEYGTTTAYGSSTALNPALVTAHSQALTGLTASTLYHYRVKSKDASGNLRTSGDFTFTTAAPPSCPCTIWASGTTPSLAATPDTRAVELGVRFRTAVAGRISGLRFYKGSGNTGTHVAHLWSSTGTLLATATFSNETATGWQQVNFATPVNVAANTTYVASYYAPVGRYAKNEGYFASAVTRGPLTALADGADGPNGVYRYGSGGGFPSSTYLSSNYWVDVVFSP